jgi:kynurenine formamidase
MGGRFAGDGSRRHSLLGNRRVYSVRRRRSRFGATTDEGSVAMCLPGTVEAVREAPISRRALIAGSGAAALAALAPGSAAAHPRPKKRRGHRVADLTHLFRAGFPMYTGDEPRRRTIRTYEEHGFYAQEWTLGEHSGTHMDAPGHFFPPPARRTPQLRPEELFAPIAVIDVSARAARNPDTAVTEKDIRRYERRHGRIPRGAAVLMRSGWDARVNDPAAYKNADASGFHFPGFGADAVEYLLERTRAAVIGVDTLSLDPGNSTTFDAHNMWLRADRYGLETIANLGSIPPRGAVLTVGVIPWEEGSGGPCRLFAHY